MPATKEIPAGDGPNRKNEDDDVTNALDLLRLSQLSFNGKSTRILTSAQGQSRTVYTRIFSPLLYQLSYLGEGNNC